MSLYIDRKYIASLQHKLERFTKKNQNLYNFRCPYCKDSRKNKIKSRGYLFTHGNNFFFRCHNCGYGTIFFKFLRDIDPVAHKAYVMETYTEGKSTKEEPTTKKKTFDNLSISFFDVFKNKRKKLNISTISELPQNHPARLYIEGRKIPEKYYGEIYFTENFSKFVKEEFPNHLSEKEKIVHDARIILLYTNKDGEITNIAGRAISEDGPRYAVVKVTEEKKVFGLDRLDFSKPAIVVEGQFDSLLLDNCVASGDSNLMGVVEHYPGLDWTVVFDNEPRNKSITKMMERAIDKGYNVVIFPKQIKEKDINEMVCAGLDPKKIISENSFRGAEALLRFIQWRNT